MADCLIGLRRRHQGRRRLARLAAVGAARPPGRVPREPRARRAVPRLVGPRAVGRRLRVAVPRAGLRRGLVAQPHGLRRDPHGDHAAHAAADADARHDEGLRRHLHERRGQRAGEPAPHPDQVVRSELAARFRSRGRRSPPSSTSPPSSSNTTRRPRPRTTSSYPGRRGWGTPTRSAGLRRPTTRSRRIRFAPGTTLERAGLRVITVWNNGILLTAGTASRRRTTTPRTCRTCSASPTSSAPVALPSLIESKAAVPRVFDGATPRTETDLETGINRASSQAGTRPTVLCSLPCRET